MRKITKNARIAIPPNTNFRVLLTPILDTTYRSVVVTSPFHQQLKSGQVEEKLLV